MSLTPRKIKGYGWRPDLPDARDYLLQPSPKNMMALEQVSKLDLSTSPNMPLVWDQGQLGSCTAFSTGATWAFAARASGHSHIEPSQLFIYYHERLLEGDPSVDGGAQVRDGFKVLNTVGTASEATWPYDITQFATKPPAKAETEAAKNKDLSYYRVNQTLVALKAALVGGYPISFGFTVYESFESQEVAETGIVPLPKPSEEVLGGHAVSLIGFDDSTARFKVRNSWSDSWGMKGYCTMPYSYILSANLCSDFWQVNKAS